MAHPQNPASTDPRDVTLADLKRLKPYITMRALAEHTGIPYDSLKGWMYYEREPAASRREDLRAGVLELADELAGTVGARIVVDDGIPDERAGSERQEEAMSE